MLKPSADSNDVRARRSNAGFTLIELVVATAAMAFVLVYTLGTFTANRNTYVVIEGVSQAHQNLLAIAGLVERDIRNAGFMVPARTAACGGDSTTAADLLFLSDSDAIRTADNLPSTLAGDELYSSPTTSPTLVKGTPVSITLDEIFIDELATYDTDATPGADSDFRDTAGVIIASLNNAGVHCGLITAVNAGAKQITVSLQSAANLPLTATDEWAIVPAHVYRINGNAIERNGVVLARNIEDLQVAWFYDLDEDGQVDGNEDLASAANPAIDFAAIADPGVLREIRLNLIARTAEDDPTRPDNAGIFQKRENRTNSAAADGRRRRVHTATIRLRNLAT